MGGVENTPCRPSSFDIASSLLSVPPRGSDRFTHRIFRYPAKFHPPVVRALLDKYTKPGDHVLDPFCGSGTLQVEASVSGRTAIGTDIDPVAVAVARVKSAIYDMHELTELTSRFLVAIDEIRRTPGEYDRRMFEDISEGEFEEVVERERLWVPSIPRLRHWFRLYVVIDLSRILRVIETIPASRPARDLLRVTFASIIRGASNADPVPVSGLEVTSHMKRKEESGRLIDPFALLVAALRKTLKGVEDLSSNRPEDATAPLTFVSDATSLPESFRGSFDAVVTSPPYHNAVDYYRRHQLEMFWLGQVSSQADRLALLPKYIGRHRVPAKDTVLKGAVELDGLAKEWEHFIRSRSSQRADDFKAYLISMRSALNEMHRVTRVGARVVMVVGKSSWNGERIPTDNLFEEICKDTMQLDEVLSYPVKNRYMSYSRRNGADIDQEFVLAFKRR